MCGQKRPEREPTGPLRNNIARAPFGTPLHESPKVGRSDATGCSAGSVSCGPKHRWQNGTCVLTESDEIVDSVTTDLLSYTALL